MKNDSPQVLLVSMPWTTVIEPSLGLGILKSCLAKSGIPNKVLHLNIDLLKYLKHETYEVFSSSYILNEFLFTSAFEKDISDKQLTTTLEKIDQSLREGQLTKLGLSGAQEVFDVVFKLRDEIIPQYLDDCVEELLKYDDAKLFGFTCMFDQTIASLALIKKLKEKKSGAFTVLGGYALTGDVGPQIMTSFDFVDAVCIGEGENVISKLFYASQDRSLLKDVPNILYRTDPAEKAFCSTYKEKADIDISPVPDYDDYLLDITRLEQTEKVKITWFTLPIENSRGCWWGEKKHCIFCGIDDVTMHYKAKGFEVVYDSIKELSGKYNIKNIRFADYILPNEYFMDLLPQLINEGTKYKIICELKANLSLQKILLLKKAGFVDIQPGIESFSSNVLKKIDKGVTGIQNISTLLLGKIHNIKVNYNIIYDFPNDEVTDYESLTETVPFLYHLDPPYSVSPVAITRFAPLQSDPARFGYAGEELVHSDVYDMLFSDDFLRDRSFNLSNYCYYFNKPYQNAPELEWYYNILYFQATYWLRETNSRDVFLRFHNHDDHIEFEDSRYTENTQCYTYGNDVKMFYNLFYGKIFNISEVYDLGRHVGGEAEIENIILELQDKKLLFREQSKIILLAIKKT